MRGRTSGSPLVRFSGMTISLADGISYGTPGGTTIVLDLDRDRYLRLGPDAAAALDDLAAGGDASAYAAGLATLFGSGILDETVGNRVAPVAVRRPEYSALEVAAVAPIGISIVSILFVTIGIRKLLRVNGLAGTVRRLRRDRAAAVLHDHGTMGVAVAQRYAQVRQLLPGRRTCIPESFALSVLLTRHGIAHDLVFGVALAPFAAHAWVQTDDHILSDRADPVRAFEPVFVL